jgi:hypothetical protein
MSNSCTVSYAKRTENVVFVEELIHETLLKIILFTQIVQLCAMCRARGLLQCK